MDNFRVFFFFFLWAAIRTWKRASTRRRKICLSRWLGRWDWYLSLRFCHSLYNLLPSPARGQFPSLSGGWACHGLMLPQWLLCGWSTGSNGQQLRGLRRGLKPGVCDGQILSSMVDDHHSSIVGRYSWRVPTTIDVDIFRLSIVEWWIDWFLAMHWRVKNKTGFGCAQKLIDGTCV